jgi:type II secretory pathway pseudopilin PulG
VCIAIVVIVGAIAYPVIVNAKEGGLKTKSISNMRQVYLALELYAQEHDGSPTGSMEEMGLPPWPSVEYLGASVKEMYPPLRPSVNWSEYAYNPIPADVDKRSPTWKEYTQEVGPSAVLLYDPFFNPQRTDDYDMYWQDPFVRKFVMGMTVSGSLVKRTRAGVLDLRWWMD